MYKVLKDMGAEDITFYFRKDKLSEIEFPENIEGDIIINTTPVGMYPNIEDNIVDEQILKKIQNSHRLNIQSLRDKIFKNSKRKWFKKL